MRTEGVDIKVTIQMSNRERVPGKNWAEACVLVADEALKVQESNELVDQSLAQELVSTLVEAERPCQALEVFTQLAVSDAQRAVNLLLREREMRSKADPEVLEELKAGIANFDQYCAKFVNLKGSLCAAFLGTASLGGVLGSDIVTLPAEQSVLPCTRPEWFHRVANLGICCPAAVAAFFMFEGCS
eukprot:s2058_g8.t1